MKKFALFSVFMLGALILGGLLLPAQVVVERSISIGRPAATVFTILNGYRSHAAWSPWYALDPAARFELSGPDQGVGARLEWWGDPALVGSGWQEIVASQPWQLIEYRMDLGSQGIAESEIRVNGDALGSRVTWQFKTDVTAGQNAFGAVLSKYFGLFLRSWVGGDFERGLESLKRYAESLPAADFSRLNIERMEPRPIPVVLVNGVSDAEPESIASAMAEAFSTLGRWSRQNDVALEGAPMAITLSGTDSPFRFQAAYPLGEGEAVSLGLPPTVELGQSPSGPAVRAIHRGSYADTLETYERIYAWIAAHGHRASGVSWEHYVTDPNEVAEVDLITHLYVQLESEP